MFCHCTHHYTTWLFGEAVSYKHGAIMCFGINYWNTKVKIILKLGSTGQRNEEVHQYLLTSAGNGQKSSETLLNVKPLNLEDEGMLPVLSPNIHHTGQNIVDTPSQEYATQCYWRAT
ncbi:uncharacterized protein LOC111870010, partial [Cryptotermes secundus]|uniref:uncharacterized protein LOC111870010 n=1 Tax=Cryptotermes secundus TaxID=105785 RepID=UPI001454B8AC